MSKTTLQSETHQNPSTSLTLPNGLLGVLITIAFVRGVNLLANSSADRTQSPLDRTVLPSSLCKKTWTYFLRMQNN